MIQDSLKAGFPALFIRTLEPHRAEDVIKTSIKGWDGLQGIRGFTAKSFSDESIRNPVEAVNLVVISGGHSFTRPRLTKLCR